MLLDFSEEADGGCGKLYPCPAKFGSRGPGNLLCYKKRGNIDVDMLFNCVKGLRKLLVVNFISAEAHI